MSSTVPPTAEVPALRVRVRRRGVLPARVSSAARAAIARHTEAERFAPRAIPVNAGPRARATSSRTPDSIRPWAWRVGPLPQVPPPSLATMQMVVPAPARSASHTYRRPLEASVSACLPRRTRNTTSDSGTSRTAAVVCAVCGFSREQHAPEAMWPPSPGRVSRTRSHSGWGTFTQSHRQRMPAVSRSSARPTVQLHGSISCT